MFTELISWLFRLDINNGWTQSLPDCPKGGRHIVQAQDLGFICRKCWEYVD